MRASFKGNQILLCAMIGNGLVKESTTGVAVLDDVDIDVFGGLCEHLYTCTYTTPSRTSTDSDKPLKMRGGMVQTPIFLWSITAMKMPNPNIKDDRKQEAQNRVYYHLGVQFHALEIEGTFASASSRPGIVYHARLYILATRFLVESLRQQCLKSLHRDFKAIIHISSNAYLACDLLDVTYSNSGRIEPGGGSPLRELVIHYARTSASGVGQAQNVSWVIGIIY